MSGLQCIWDAKAELGEGVLWHPEEQVVYWVDIIHSQLYRYQPGGEQRSWNLPGKVSSVVPCTQGGLLATFADGVFHIELEKNKVTQQLSIESELPNNRFNDGCCDTQGNFWFGSMDNGETNNTGRFYRLNNNGQLDTLNQFGEICITNGPTFSQDQQWVYYTDTLKQTIYRAALQSQGDIGQPEVFILVEEGDGYPDGMCTDTEGYLWVCHWGGFRITRFDPAGNIDRVIDLPVPNITKCAFGGKAMNTLYVTTASKGLTKKERLQYPLAGGLFAIELDQQGFCFPPASLPNP